MANDATTLLIVGLTCVPDEPFTPPWLPVGQCGAPQPATVAVSPEYHLKLAGFVVPGGADSTSTWNSQLAVAGTLTEIVPVEPNVWPSSVLGVGSVQSR